MENYVLATRNQLFRPSVLALVHNRTVYIMEALHVKQLITKAGRNVQTQDQNLHERNDAMRHHWEKAVCQELGVPDRYSKVAALMIRWDNEFDKDLRCETEVSDRSH